MDETKVRTARPACRRTSGRRPPAKGSDPAQLGHALEALRVVTTFLVVLYHAALTYVSTPLRLTMWVAYDASGYAAFDAFIYWVNGPPCPCSSWPRSLRPAACESRASRFPEPSGAPFVASLAVRLPDRPARVLPDLGLRPDGHRTLRPESLLSWRFPPAVRDNLYGSGTSGFSNTSSWSVSSGAGPGLSSGKFGRRPETPRDRDEETLPTRWLGSACAPLLFAIPTTLIFLVDSDTMLRVDNVIVPNLFRLLHYAFFFAVGGWISKVRSPSSGSFPMAGSTWPFRSFCSR